MKATIRRMNATDLDEVYAIETSVHLAPWSKSILRDCFLVGYECRILEFSGSNSELGGFLIARIADELCHILNFCIAKPFQSQGWGRQFLQTFITSLSKEAQVNSVILEVRPSNKAALHLYHTMGFNQIELKKDYYNDSFGIEDGIVLKKEL